jgi:hypothetical protein
MSMRRFTRLTNAFSKRIDDHEAAVAFSAMWYNVARIHQSLRVTPASAITSGKRRKLRDWRISRCSFASRILR